MDKQYTSVLKYIYKNKYVPYPELKNHFAHLTEFDSIVDFLIQQNMISPRAASCAEDDDGYETLYLQDDSHFLTINNGNSYIEARRREDIRWIITTAIAVFAAIGAYREELASILQVLMR